MPARSSAASAPLFLKGARVTTGFRASLFDAANRAGITPNEFCIEAAAEKLSRCGASFPGVFRAGDLDHLCKFAPARDDHGGGGVPADGEAHGARPISLPTV